ncbi:MAG TPA: putative baseplate assembly protein [Candidatus Cybelea sp.]|nr:putative baseplate assembly protein [Candidatus Cybelea sp.]
MTPRVWNRPGLDALAYRVGTYGSFFSAMKARLSSAEYPGLARLRTRDIADWTIGLLDGWASIADVLTFYQERIANEGYLRTATQRLSVLELGRTVGYSLRPGVAATAYLAYTMDPTADVTIPAGTLAQSTPGQGQTAQPFETSADLHATGAWNTLGVRMHQPQLAIDLSQGPPSDLYLQGTNLSLNPDDVLLLVETASDAKQVAARIRRVEIQAADARTRVVLTPFAVQVAPAPAPKPSVPARVEELKQGAESKFEALKEDVVSRVLAHKPPVALSKAAPTGLDSYAAIGEALLKSSAPQLTTAVTAVTLLGGYAQIADNLLKPPAAPPASPLQLKQNVQKTFSNENTAAKTLAVLHPELSTTLFVALEQAMATPPSPIEVYAFGVKALPFGANAPLQLLGFRSSAEEDHTKLNNVPDYSEWMLADDEATDELWLDRFYPALAPGSWIVTTGPGLSAPAIAKIKDIEQTGRAQYGLSGSPAHLTLSAPWYDKENASLEVQAGIRKVKEYTIGFLRKTNVFAQSEKLTLADVPITDEVKGDTILLDGVYEGLETGRWIVVTGTRTDVPGVPGSELMMILAIDHVADATRPGDTLHTRLTLSTALAYTYDRTTVQIYGNVVAATNGQTWNETLGSGSGSLALQLFTLKQKPLTFVPDQSAAGVETTLQVSVNGVAWVEAGGLDEMTPTQRGYVTRTDNSMNTSIMFGDGVHGSRLPTGVENVTAVYRAGIGSPGNVAADQITLLAARPLGVRSVTNPQPASGGVDPESVDQGRANVPLVTAALDRVVSLSDYEFVARTFAGVAKALAMQFAGSPPLVHVTIAPGGDIAITSNSPLVTSLSAALVALGSQQVTIDVQPRSLLVLALSADVALSTGAQWEDVEPAIRATLLDQFGFDRRGLAQEIYLSEVIAAIQNVDGVSYVNVTVFDSVSDSSETGKVPGITALASTPRPNVSPLPPRRAGDGSILPAQIAVFPSSLPEAIVLQLVES